MNRNLYRTNKFDPITTTILRYMKSIPKLLMVGLDYRQCVTCVLICSMIGLLTSMPTGVTVVYGAGNEDSKFERVNEDLPVYTSQPTDARNMRPKTVSNEHQYLQMLVKRIGEDNGYVATLEKEVFGGIGKIDVALDNGKCKIACEIAVTNKAGYELQNIQKCLSAGLDCVVVISSDSKHLKNIRKRTELILSPAHLCRVYFLEPENFHLFLSSLTTPNSSTVDPEKIKGYVVRTSFRNRSESEIAPRKKTVADILARANLRRKRRSEEDSK